MELSLASMPWGPGIHGACDRPTRLGVALATTQSGFGDCYSVVVVVVELKVGYDARSIVLELYMLGPESCCPRVS